VDLTKSLGLCLWPKAKAFSQGILPLLGCSYDLCLLVLVGYLNEVELGVNCIEIGVRCVLWIATRWRDYWYPVWIIVWMSWVCYIGLMVCVDAYWLWVIEGRDYVLIKVKHDGWRINEFSIWVKNKWIQYMIKGLNQSIYDQVCEVNELSI
jgi:hypothetical protein